MTDIVDRLLQVQGDNKDARQAAAEIKRLRVEVAILRTTEAAEIERLKAEIEQLLISAPLNMNG